MAKKPEANGATEEAPQVKMQVLAQFIKDMSFENIVSQKGVTANPTPEISVQVSLDAKKRSVEHQYEVATKFAVTAKGKGTEDVLFLMELDYGGVFHVEGVPEEQLHPFLMIECPRLLFPFARRIIHDVIRDGGFPPLNLETIDWVSLYRQNLARQAENTKVS